MNLKNLKFIDLNMLRIVYDLCMIKSTAENLLNLVKRYGFGDLKCI